MRRKGLPASAAVAALACLALCLMLLGSRYAAWAAPLNVAVSAKTGAMNIVFDASEPFDVRICASDGTTTLSEAGPVSCELSEDGKHARLSVDQSLLIDELIQPGRVLVLRHPLRYGDGNAVGVAPLPADLDGVPADTIVSVPHDVELTVDGNLVELDGESQSLPSLSFDVYRQIETSGDGGRITGTIFLRLRSESAQAFLDNALVIDAAQLPQEFLAFTAPSIEDPTTTELIGEIQARYSLSLPLDLYQDYPMNTSR